MNYLKEKHTLNSTSDVGGKGRQLQLLHAWNKNVPDFFIITTSSFEYFQRNKKFPNEIYLRMESFFSKYEKVSIRSSMVNEDSKDFSFAGIFETILNVTKDGWENALEQVYSSLNSDRAREYLKNKNITNPQMAVVVQRMIQSQKSGIIFTRSPLVPTSLFLIDAGMGLGEGVVSGLTDTDHYKLDRFGKVISLIKKNEELVLTEEELRKLFNAGLETEQLLGGPADIEWGICGDEIFFFQVRPITQEFKELGFFVDTNLSESYPGVVSPFTADFVQKAYRNVFYESAVILGGTGKRLESLDFHYNKLISYVEGHLYYNLEHYYAVLTALPGGKRNIRNWHAMIGGDGSIQGIRTHDTSPSLLETMSSLWRLLKIGFNHRHVFKKFISDLNRIKREIDEEGEKKKTSRELIAYLNELVSMPLGFGYTVVNDIYVMMGLSLLSSLAKKQGLSDEDIIDLLRPEERVESILPLKRLHEVSSNLSDEFISAFSKEDLNSGVRPYQRIFKSLNAMGFTAEVGLVEGFLKDYGERSFEELKLESLPLSNSPKDLFQLISWYRGAKPFQDFQSAERKELRGFAKIVHKFVHSAVKTREETRLFRGKFYNVIRMLLLRIQEKLIQEDTTWIEFETKDFFSVTASEWRDLNFTEIKQIMKERSSWKNSQQIYPEVLCWVKGEELVHDTKGEVSGELNGQGVSQGEIEGVVLVLDSPSEVFQSTLENVILVTKNTDPAWVYVMSQSKGLISEKGSLLSHTAIIGRELGIPTVVGVRNATKLLRSGEKILLNGRTGEIKRL